MLVDFLEKYPDKLRADFQEFYGLNLDGMGHDYTLSHAADLAVNLPRTSRVFSAIDYHNTWSQADYLLAGIEFWTHSMYWGFTKDGQKGRNKPEPLEPVENNFAKTKKPTDVENIKRRLAKKHKAVK